MSGLPADPPDSIEAWSRRLGLESFPGRWTVVDEVGSTQDLAREAGPGVAVTALRQRSGRGRLGRAWADTGSDGLAVTFALPPAAGADRWLAIATALAAVRAIEATSGVAVAIKWPNDLVVAGRKLGGILIERTDRATLVGIGMNVSQPEFAGELAATATSLLREGVRVARLDLLVRLAREFASALGEPEPARKAEFDRRDALRGAWVRVRSAGEELEGRVRRVEPVDGLTIETGQGPRFLPAATASILAWRPG